MTNEQLVVQIKAGIDAPGNMLALWEQMRKFISMIARKYAGYAELEDLEQEGYIALCKAVDHYEEEGAAFTTYAAYWIKQQIVRYIEESGATVRIPTNERIAQQRYNKAVRVFLAYHGRKPTQAEIAHCMGVSVKRVESIEKSLRMATIKSLDQPIEEGEGNALGDFVPSGEDMEGDTLDRVQHGQLKAVLWSLADSLPDQQGRILRLRYQEGKTLKEVGEVISISKERVRTVQDKAIRNLRKAPYIDQLRPFLPEKKEALCYRHCGVSEFNRTWTSSVERAALEG